VAVTAVVARGSKFQADESPASPNCERGHHLGGRQLAGEQDKAHQVKAGD